MIILGGTQALRVIFTIPIIREKVIHIIQIARLTQSHEAPNCLCLIGATSYMSLLAVHGLALRRICRLFVKGISILLISLAMPKDRISDSCKTCFLGHFDILSNVHFNAFIFLINVFFHSFHF